MYGPMDAQGISQIATRINLCDHDIGAPRGMFQQSSTPYLSQICVINVCLFDAFRKRWYECMAPAGTGSLRQPGTKTWQGEITVSMLERA